MTIKRATVKDYEQVKAILTRDEVYPSLVDDGSDIGKRLFSPYAMLQDDRIFILFVTENSLMSFCPVNSSTYDMHVCIVPEDRNHTVDLAHEAWTWMFDNTKCEKLTAGIPEFNQLAQAAAQAARLTKEGISTKSFKRDGILYDRILYGITKEEWQCLS